MKKVKLLATIAIFVSTAALFSGCVPQQKYQAQIDKNRQQSVKIDELSGKLRSAELQLKQCRSKLQTAQELTGADMQALKAEITALEEDIARKTDLIERMKAELIRGTPQLPMELSIALQEFAESNDMITFDEATGILKFKSDLLFRSGSAQVMSSADEAIKQLSSIMDSEQAKQFDLVVAGHTDSDPIKYSKAKHPTNWHLSAHRAISVLEKMVADGISPKRISIRGFGEQRPVEPNDTKEGKASNRRVEIYVVAKGR